MKRLIVGGTLFVATVCALAAEECPVAENLRGQENTEWSRSYAYHLTDGRKSLPRALLVGDSIVNDYESEARKMLEANGVNTTYWISSYCVTSPHYLTLLGVYLDEAKYDVIHFNNGLHSLGTATKDWTKGFHAALSLIREKQPEARIVWCTSTPLTSDKNTAKVRELNAAGAKIVERMGGIETHDLFALLDALDREANWRDEFHHKPHMREKEGMSVAKAVLAALEHKRGAAAKTEATRPQNVPELMKGCTTAAQWEANRALEILDTFRREVFGFRPPQVEERSRVSFRVVSKRELFGGKGVQKVVEARFAGGNGDFAFKFTLVAPKGAKKIPAFVTVGLARGTLREPDGGCRSFAWPVEEIVSRGYATVYFCNADVAEDAPKGLKGGVFAATGTDGVRGASDWGVISAWAWAASRVMDYLETDETIDSSRVAVVGHSRGGKTALWAGANDHRFAMVCANDSGCSGAKLNHIDLPKSEHIAQITKSFPHWFCPNYFKYAGREREMPFDQHELLSLIAPRLLCVDSATLDAWAGPSGEWWAAFLASDAWKLYGKAGLAADAPPKPDAPQADGCVGYFLRSGAHDLANEDWRFYMDFAEKHGWRPAWKTRCGYRVRPDYHSRLPQ